jgi:hydrogenase maturation protease
VRARVIGIGNEDRGDDAAGLLAVRWLHPRLPSGTEAVEADGDPARLLDLLAGVDRVILVDASEADGSPGRVRRLLPAAAGRSRLTASTHDMGLPEALALAAALGAEPDAVVYTVEGGSFEPGRRVTSEVERGARLAGEQILAELSA